jgi:hypothetical protein
MNPERWQNRSPGDLRILLDPVEATPVEPALAAAARAARSGHALPSTNAAAC